VQTNPPSGHLHVPRAGWAKPNFTGLRIGAKKKIQKLPGCLARPGNLARVASREHGGGWGKRRRERERERESIFPPLTTRPPNTRTTNKNSLIGYTACLGQSNLEILSRPIQRSLASAPGPIVCVLIEAAVDKKQLHGSRDPPRRLQ
jgi:hypothetical protein